jgi:5'-methylthioadenosine phosphorylase
MNAAPVRIALIARAAAHEPFLSAGTRELDLFRAETPFGRSNPIHMMEADGLSFALLSRHGEKGYEVAAPWVNDRANLYALKDIGVERIVSWSSPGSLDDTIGAGDLVLPDDVLDETRAPPFSFFEGMGIGVIRMSDPFCPNLRAAFAGALRALEIPFHDGGVYTGTQGPRLETGAEVKKLKTLGGSVVGMTVVPEVFLARELEICYGSVCLVVNQAEGLRRRSYAPDKLFEGLADEEEFDRVRRMELLFPTIALALLKGAAEKKISPEGNALPECHCPAALERYRSRGDIGQDWRNWWK